MQNKKLTSLLVLMMSVIIMIGAFCLPASAATSIKNTTITYTSSQTYKGSAIKPAVTVKNGKTKLKAGTHYTVSYKNNKSVGKATITVTGKGSYKDKVTKYFYINPKAVTELKATPSANNIKLTWKKSTGATAYEIQQKNGSKWSKAGTTSNASFTVTGLDSITKYEFRVRATAKAGTKALNSAFKTVSAKTTIGKPTGISASDITESTATLKWSKVQGATSYRVTLTNISTGFKKNLTSTANSIKLTGLTALSQFKVTVVARNTAKSAESAASAAYNFTTSPAGVSNVTATVSSDASVKLTWTSGSNADTYKVSYSRLDASGNPTAYIDYKSVTAESCTVTGLAPCSYYVFKVVAGVKKDSDYVYSKEAVSAKVLVPVTKVPDFSAKANGTNILLSWTRPSNIEGYKIYKNGTLVTTLDPRQETYTIKNLTEGTSCTVGICAYYKNVDGETTEINVTVGSTVAQGMDFASKPSSLKVGDTYQLSVKFTPDNVSNKSVTYTSGNTNVATVSASGLVTAKAAGTATITATSVTYPNLKASLTLTVSAQSSTVPVSSVSLKSEYTLYEGDIISLNPTFSPANATNKQYTVTGADNGDYKFANYINITTSSFLDAKKATTDSSGKAFYLTVTVTTKDGGKTATTRVKVLPRMIYLEYNGTEDSPWYCGNSAKLNVSLNDEITDKYSLSNIYFRSSDTSIATVTNDGTVTCKGVGDVTITAYTSDNKYQGDFKLYSRKGLYIADKFIDSCQVGKTYPIAAEIRPSAGSEVLGYYSDNTNVATVDSNGVVTFKAAGSVMISVHISSDPFNPQYVWLTTNKFTAPSGTNTQLLGSMRTTANSLKSLKNLPSITRYDETVTTGFSISSNKISAAEIQEIFNSELAPKNNYYAPVVSTAKDYTTLKTNFMNNVPVAGQQYMISPNLSDADVQNITISNNDKDYCYEMKLTLREESMSSLPSSGASTRHGKVFDVLTSQYIDTYLDKINAKGTVTVTYKAFAQRYHNSTLTLRVNKATGNIENATYDMNIDINIANLNIQGTIYILGIPVKRNMEADVSFNCNNIVIIDFADYQ